VTFVEFCRRGGLELLPFQKRIYRAISGPERECVVLLPRDCGKSRLVAAVAVWWLVTGTESVFCAATSRDQAHLVLTYAKRMARELGDPHLVERSHDLRWCPDPNQPSVRDRQLRALAADAGKLHGLKGRWILDELHAAGKRRSATCGISATGPPIAIGLALWRGLRRSPRLGGPRLPQGRRGA
jgi:phage terminase large subunit-like protein